ncbi:MAG TPA: hypothetical protein VFQ35_18475 [Polyangiaceae bacterium]|nr:hypothetical protein [Polyangiaceae bacterium]
MTPGESQRPFRASPRRYAAAALSPSCRPGFGAWLIALGIALLALVSRPVCAEPEAEPLELLELEWDAPAGCASAPQIREELARIVRARPGRGFPRLIVHARVYRERVGYRAVIEVVREQERTHREFKSADCAALVRAATVSIALSFGDGDGLPEVAPSSSEEATRQEPKPPTPLSSRAAEAVEAARPRESAAPVRRSLAVAPGFAWAPNWLGGNDFGAQATMSVRSTGAVLAWQNRVWLPRSLRATDAVGARFWAASSSVSLALVYAVRPLELEFGIGLQAAVVHGAGFGVASPARAWAPSYSVVPSLSVLLELRRGVRVAVGEELTVALARPKFEIAPVGEVYRVPSLTAITTVSMPFDVSP